MMLIMNMDQMSIVLVVVHTDTPFELASLKLHILYTCSMLLFAGHWSNVYAYGHVVYNYASEKSVGL